MGTSKNSLKPSWQRCKAAQNAHVRLVHCAFFDPSRLAITGLIKFLKVPFCWCRRRDSNSHSFRHYPLKIACLPISPRRHIVQNRPNFTSKREACGSATTQLLGNLRCCWDRGGGRKRCGCCRRRCLGCVSRRCRAARRGWNRIDRRLFSVRYRGHTLTEI